MIRNSSISYVGTIDNWHNVSISIIHLSKTNSIRDALGDEGDFEHWWAEKNKSNCAIHDLTSTNL